ncbi:MAG: DUF488 family protein [Terriglobales bacterium]
MTATIFTIGHSTRPIETFIGLLQSNRVQQVADVRTVPKSRHNPQFAQEVLDASLTAAGIGYRHLPRLGGLRHARPDSVNLGWRNLSFRGFADYMQSLEFRAGLDELEEWARARPSAIMCAEAVPWRCHRSLIGDSLEVRGWEVLDIISGRPPQAHRPTPFLQVVDGRLSYPEPQPGD